MMSPEEARPSLPSDALAHLGDVARRYLAAEAPESELDRVACAVAREARLRGMRAEELLVACKTVWRELPVGPSGLERVERAKGLERVVKACLDGYFEPE